MRSVRDLSTAAAMAAFDVVARRAGYEFEEASVPEEGREALALRWKVYAQHGYIDPSDHPDGTFRDRYDAHSTLLTARHRGRVVGTARLIPAALGTQILDQYAVRLPSEVDLAKTAELGRFAVDPDHRGGARFPALGLFRAALLSSEAAGVQWWIGNASKSFIRSMTLYCGGVARLQEGPLGPEHLEARRIMGGYFATLGSDIELFLVDLREVRFSFAQLIRLLRRGRKARGVRHGAPSGAGAWQAPLSPTAPEGAR